MVCGECFEVFAFRHWRAPGDASEDYGLRDFRERQRFAGRGHRCHGRGNAGYHGPFNVGGGKRPGHFDQRAVKPGVSGLQADDYRVATGLIEQPGSHFVERHVLRVADCAAFRGVERGGLIDQRAGVKDGAGLFEQFASLDGDEVGVAGTGADKPDFSGH